jgi:hypothetical protein
MLKLTASTLASNLLQRQVWGHEGVSSAQSAIILWYCHKSVALATTPNSERYRETSILYDNTTEQLVI